MSYYDGGWAPYVPVAQRRANAAREVARRMKKLGRAAAPVEIEGRTIANTFWGKGWCDNLERYSDFENRIPRGRTYVRNGSVVDLVIEPGRIESLVSGSHLYQIAITIRPLPAPRWKKIVAECAGGIGSLVELLQGRFSDGVMAILARPKEGLFPSPAEIDMDCSCPDGAYMCKHIAATLYGVGARLDREPELFFKLRKVDQLDLVTHVGKSPILSGTRIAGEKKLSRSADLSKLFHIDLEAAPVAPASRSRSTIVKRPAAAVAAPRRARKQPAKPATPPPQARLTAAQLVAAGIPRTTFQNWVTQGVLQRTAERGVYLQTPESERRILNLLAAPLSGNRAR
jgi:uncharacterized Zn finger protein